MKSKLLMLKTAQSNPDITFLNSRSALISTLDVEVRSLPGTEWSAKVTPDHGIPPPKVSGPHEISPMSLPVISLY